MSHGTVGNWLLQWVPNLDFWLHLRPHSSRDSGGPNHALPLSLSLCFGDLISLSALAICLSLLLTHDVAVRGGGSGSGARQYLSRTRRSRTRTRNGKKWQWCRPAVVLVRRGVWWGQRLFVWLCSIDQLTSDRLLISIPLSLSLPH
jgi:hypothetical protein